MTKYMTKLMTNWQAINEQNKMTNFGHVRKDRKLATSDRQTKIGHWYADFGHFFGH